MSPHVAILGRPNVGKSTLFNRLVGRRRALVDATPGVTRDRLYGTCDWRGYPFRLVDTGGIDLAASSLSQVIREQSLQAVAEADLILCVFDAGDGLTSLDTEMVTIARRSGCPVVYAVNKVDTEGHLRAIDAFAALGTDAVFPISAEHGRRIDDLLDAIVSELRQKAVTCDTWDETARHFHPPCHMSHVTGLHLAIIGRPNVGKSSLVNRLAGARRVVAHELPGTTRDVVDVSITIGNRHMVLLDTAGIRRKARTDHRVEKYSILKSLEAMERADVVVLLIDASEGITHQDRQLASRIAEAYRPFLVVANKWDLVPRRKAVTVLEELRRGLKELQRAPLLTVSARTGLRCPDLLQRAQAQVGATHRRIKTARLNTLLQAVQAQHHLPSYRSQPVRLYYATQVGENPPSFTIFANYPASIPVSYRRYLLKALEDAIGAPGLPIRLLFRKRG